LKPFSFLAHLVIFRNKFIFGYLAVDRRSQLNLFSGSIFWKIALLVRLLSSNWLLDCVQTDSHDRVFQVRVPSLFVLAQHILTDFHVRSPAIAISVQNVFDIHRLLSVWSTWLLIFEVMFWVLPSRLLLTFAKLLGNVKRVHLRLICWRAYLNCVYWCVNCVSLPVEDEWVLLMSYMRKLGASRLEACVYSNFFCI